ASHLRASQSELGGSRVALAIRQMADPDHPRRQRQIWVTSDGYIVDGHHHWAALVGLGHREGSDPPVRVRQIDSDIVTILDDARGWVREMGAPQVAVGSNEPI